MKRTRLMITVTLMLAMLPAMAEDKADVDGSKIIGNRELPKVIYIVPWKKPTRGELAARPLESVVDEALAPVDKDEFRRQIQYDSASRPKLATPNDRAATSKSNTTAKATDASTPAAKLETK